MKKSNQRNAKQGLATRLKLPFVTLQTKEHFGAGRFNRKILVNLPVLHTLQCIERIKALSCCVNLGGTADFFRP